MATDTDWNWPSSHQLSVFFGNLREVGAELEEAI